MLIKHTILDIVAVYSVITFPLFLLIPLSLDGAGKLPTGYALFEGHPDLK